MIYLAYFLGNLAVMKARLGGWPKVSSPFKLGVWGPIVNVLALAYGASMLVNFAWPRGASNPRPNQTLGALSLGLHFLNKIPILYTVLAFILIIGIIYYALFEIRKPLPVHVPAESGRRRDPAGVAATRGARLGPSSAASREGLLQCSGRSKLQTTTRVRSPRNKSLANRPAGPRRRTPPARPAGAARRGLTPSSCAAWLSARTGLEVSTGPARPGPVTHRQQLVERALERLFEHPGKTLRREARRLEDDRPPVGEPQPGDLEDRRPRFELEAAGDLVGRRHLVRMQQPCARRQAEAPRLLRETPRSWRGHARPSARPRRCRPGDRPNAGSASVARGPTALGEA